MRAGEELGLPGTAIPLGLDDESEEVSEEGTSEKHLPQCPQTAGASEGNSAPGTVHPLPQQPTSCL